MKAFRTCTFIGVRVNFCKRRMERARSVISDSDLRSMAGGRVQEGGMKGSRVIGLTVEKGISLAGQLLPNKGRGI